MGFNIGKVAAGVATGGLTFLGDKLLGQSTRDASQIALETPEQTQARQALLEFAKTGKYNGFTAGGDMTGYTPGGDVPGYTPGASIFADAGKAYDSPMGSYDMSGLESAGQNKLMSLLQSGRPDIFNAGTNELNKLFSTDTYDPYSATGLYSGFKKNADRESQDAADALKRNSAFGGTLYNSDTTRSLGRLGEVTSTNLQNKLAELYDTFAQRRLSAVPMALQAGTDQQNLDMGLVDSSQKYGGLSRMLQDTDLQRKYQEAIRARSEGYGEATRQRGEVSTDAARRRNEITADASRRRSEEQLPLSVLNNVANKDAQFGVPSVTVPVANPWDRVLDLLASGAGQALGRKAA